MTMPILRRILSLLVAVSMLVVLLTAYSPAAEQPMQPGSVTFKVQRTSERMEMTVNTSRILSLDQKIWKAQVNNGDVLEQTPLSPTQVQVYAKKAGVTQVHLFTETDELYTIDVIVYGDAQELEMLLHAQFPNASLKVVPVNSSVLISGYVEQPEHARLITRIAEEYYPRVIDNMVVSGVQQVVLHVKVMEVSRTKLRSLGFDFAKITGDNLVVSGVSGLLTSVAGEAGTGLITSAGESGLQTTGAETFAFKVGDSSSAFFGVLEAMRQDGLMKVLAEPALVTVSGRAAQFHVGGEFNVVPQGLAAAQPIQINYGTTVDFVPIVLGNGRIRLEVRPKVSEIDASLSVDGIPARRTRTVDTGVEMGVGQTLAIAGLVQTRIEAENKGLPWVSEVPYVGMLFRRVYEKRNEVELLVLVTPELVDAMDAHEVPPCGPGMRTTSPDDADLFFKGHLEVPNCCPPTCDSTVQMQEGWGAITVEDGMIVKSPAAATADRSPEGGGVQSRSQYTSPSPQYPSIESRSVVQKPRTTLIGPAGYDVLE
jgi:pilus assembly protein CpaC